jgi:hypothetical protein
MQYKVYDDNGQGSFTELATVTRGDVLVNVTNADTGEITQQTQNVVVSSIPIIFTDIQSAIAACPAGGHVEQLTDTGSIVVYTAS